MNDESIGTRADNVIGEVVRKQLTVQFRLVRGIVGVAMTIGTQRDTFPDAVSLFYSEDVVHIQEPRIVLRLPAASSLTAARASTPRRTCGSRLTSERVSPIALVALPAFPGCVFHANRTLIPRLSERPFHGYPNTH
ncbi:hypothetical protein, partial [Burkholderia ubonensis]|uniref:hypothetical protein n=1 Tax=Burkholderia ubonensis TaxID=101571 RepID=UPI001E53F6C3